MEAVLDQALAGWKLNQGSDKEQIRRVETRLGTTLPEDYVAFLLRSNGGEGFIRHQYISLWKVEELEPLNGDYQIGKYIPKHLGIGTDGGGDCFAFNYSVEANEPNVIKVPLGDLDIKETTLVSDTFREFLANG